MSEDNQNSPPKNNSSRRAFLRKATGLAAGSAVSLSGLVACGDTPQPTAVPTTEAITTKAVTSTVLTTAPTTAAISTAQVANTASTIATTNAPTATPVPPIFRFNIYGDIRTAGLKPPPIFNKLLNMSKENNPEAAVIVGDIINAEDDDSYVRQQWAALKEAFAQLGKVQLLPTIGNHDTNYRKGATPLYVETFANTLPKNGPDGFVTQVYSLDLGPVHFVSVASELPAQPHQFGKVQMDWLEKDLKANRQPYTFVFSHNPAFPVGPHVGNSLDVYPKERDAFWKLLVDNKVTAYVVGHEHLYNKINKNGVYQLVIGTSGSYPYGGYGGDYYHFATFETTQQGLQMRIIDETGKERDKVIFKPSF